MALPGVSVSEKDGGLGVSQQASRTIAIVGTCSLGTANACYKFSSKDDIVDTLGHGPLVEALVLMLSVAGGPVIGSKVAASNAGSVGTVTLTGSGVDPGFGTTGTPLAGYDILVEITTGGAVGTAKFKISFDGGDTYSEILATAASLTKNVAETGLTLTFAAGTYVLGDVYSATATPPTYGSSDLSTALDNLKTSGYDFEGVYVVGTVGGADDATKVTNHVALATAVGTKITAWKTANFHKFFVLECPEVADAAWTVAAVSGFEDSSQSWVAGTTERYDAVEKKQFERHAGAVFAARVAQIPRQRDPGRVRDGKLLGGIVSLNRDEAKTEGLNDLRIVTLRTHLNRTGFFVTKGWTMAALSSDFGRIGYRRVMNHCLTATHYKLQEEILDEFEVYPADSGVSPGEAGAPGTLLEEYVRTLESRVNAYLKTQLVETGEVSSVSFQVTNRTENVLSSNTIKYKVEMLPKGYAETITGEASFSNPALTL
jgi:hypothetical protein